MKEDLCFAKNIKDLIEKSGFKQKAIAIRAGYNPKNFSNMLNGRKTITAKDIIPIAKALGVEPNDLFGFQHNKVIHKN